MLELLVSGDVGAVVVGRWMAAMVELAVGVALVWWWYTVPLNTCTTQKSTVWVYEEVGKKASSILA